MAIALTLAACTTPENPVPTDEPDTPETLGAEILSTNTKTASGPCLSTMP